jgi:protoheme IX farnesyltransferase
MPHFYAIAIRRFGDYAAAKIPVLPVARGIHAAKVQMLLYIIAFIVIAPLLFVFGYAGYAYLAVALVLGVTWLVLCIKGFSIPDGTDAQSGSASAVLNVRWARTMFFASLAVMLLLFITIAIGAIVR